MKMILPALLAASCDGKGLDVPGGEVDAEGTQIQHGMIVLGEQLEDPYSVENMTKALAAVYPTKADRVVLSATHLYVRFLPEGDAQFRLLEQMGLQLMDHPMDYAILREGDYYHDPEVDEDRITWQYAVVEKDFVFPSGIRHELLDQCYIPGDQPASKADGVDWAAVEREAFRLTGNAALLPEDAATKAAEGTSGTPKGRITIVDSTKGVTEGVKGVRVSCNCFVKVASAYTDENGYYEMDKSFTTNPRYRLVFKNTSGFSLGFNLLLVPASVSTLGKNGVEGLDYEVTEDSDRMLFLRCAVNNAGYDYYRWCKSDTPQIKTPPANLRIWLFSGLHPSCAVMMHQGVLVEGGKLTELLGEYASLIKIFLPDLTLGMKDKQHYADVYSTTMHELAHASHFMLAGKDFWDKYARFIVTSFVTSGFVAYGVGTEEDHGHCEVGEMWAYFLQASLFRERYGDTGKTFGLIYWFHPQILLQLEDRGLPAHKIFQVLDGEVTDRAQLKKKLSSYYPELKGEINAAFQRYN